MNHPDSGLSSSTNPLDGIVSRYLESLQAGERIDRFRILAEHPEDGQDIIARLEAFIDLEWASEPERPRQIGDYTIRRQIGRGGMGVVYEAWENSMDRRVALKVLPPGVAADERALHRFVREAKAAGQLSHPNVVSVYAMGVKEQTPYYAMEFVEGETLAQILSKLKEAEPEAETPFGKKDYAGYFEKIAEAFAAVADGLQHAHSRGIIHRDIKPSNLILDGEGRLRILDFGLAHLEGQESLTATGDFLGTPLYMSPEQARRKKIPIDHRTDIYSLGTTLYELIAGRPPFQGKDHGDTLSQIIERDPVEPRKINLRVPRDLETIVLMCLRKDPAERYGTAEALGQDLRRFVRGDAIEARPQPRWERLFRRAWSYRIRIVAALLSTLFLLVSALFVARNIEDRKRSREDAYRGQIRSALPLIHLGLIAVRRGGGDPDDRRTFSLQYRGRKRLVGGEPAVDPVVKALDTLAKAVEMIPSRPEARYFRARGLWLLGHEEEALAEVDRILEVEPGFVPANLLRVMIAGDRPGQLRMDGIPVGEEVLAGNWPALWLESHRACAEGRWKDAVGVYDELIRLANRDVEPFVGFTLEARLGRGMALLASGRLLEASYDFRRAEEDWPKSPAPSLLLGETYLRMGEEGRAKECFDGLWQRTAFRDEVALEVAIIYFVIDRLRQGLDWAEKMGPGPVRDRLRADCLSILGRREEAIDVAESLVSRDRSDALSQAWLAVVCSRIERKAPSVPELARVALERSPDDPYVRWLLGRAFQNVKAYPEAEEMFRDALKEDPAYCSPSYGICECLEGEGRTDEAIDCFRLHVERFPEEYFGHTKLAELFLEKGDLVTAMEWVQRALVYHPGFGRPRSALARTLDALGREPAEVEEAYRQAIGTASPWMLAAEHRRFADYLRRKGDLADAFVEVRHALEADALFAPAHDLLEEMLEAGKGDASGLPGLDGILVTLQESWNAGGRNPRAIRSLVRCFLSRRRANDLDVAESHAARWVEETLRRDAGALSLLAEVRAARGKPREALDLLEEARRLPGFTLRDEDRLRELRADLFPELPSFGSIDQALEEQLLVPEDGGGSRNDLIRTGFLRAADPPAVLDLYMEARIDEMTGRWGEALERYRRLAGYDPGSTLVAARAAHCARAKGDIQGAEEAIREELRAARDDAGLWELWLDLSFAALKRSPSETAEFLPEPAEPGGTGDRRDLGDDVRWLLERLAKREPILIDCGGSGCDGSDGRSWRRDCFWRDGWTPAPYIGNVAGTEDDLLERTERRFPRGLLRSFAYRFPLPDGRYRIRVHLLGLEGRRFGVVIAGKQILPADYRVPHAVAEVHEAEVELTGSALEIRLLPNSGHPAIAAIEIERM